MTSRRWYLTPQKTCLDVENIKTKNKQIHKHSNDNMQTLQQQQQQLQQQQQVSQWHSAMSFHSSAFTQCCQLPALQTLIQFFSLVLTTVTQCSNKQWTAVLSTFVIYCTDLLNMLVLIFLTNMHILYSPLVDGITSHLCFLAQQRRDINYNGNF